MNPHRFRQASDNLGIAKECVKDALDALEYHPESATQDEQILMGIVHLLAKYSTEYKHRHENRNCETQTVAGS